MHDHIVELAAYLAPRADGRIAIYACTHIDNGVVAHGYRSAETAAFHDCGVVSNVYRAVHGVERASFDKFGIILHEDIFAASYYGDGVAQRRRGAPGGDSLEVFAQHFAVYAEDIVQK